uniref:WSC domain-containing protein n=1 Tax=Macrostomum lignano TaxID=282301 RepID=A0A1I8J3W7_9PLAT
MQTLSILPLILCCCIALGHSLGAEFGHLGCFVDEGTPNRDLTGLVGLSTIGPHSKTPGEGDVAHSSMTLELCSEICAYGKFRYFGVQNSAGCFCGNSYGDTARQPTATATWPALETPPKSAEGRGETPCTGRSTIVQPVRSLTECLLARCVTDCQAVLFHLDACHLLRFPVLPHELKNVAGKFATRV